jgi:hypothetical protein
MTFKLSKMTDAQLARLPAIRDEWLKIGLSCEPLDFEAAKAAAIDAYHVAGLKEPKYFFRFRSPIEAAYAAANLKSAQVGAQVGAQVRAQVWAQVGDQVWDQVGAQVRPQVWAQVGAQVRDQVRAQVMDQVMDQVRAQVWDQVWDQGWNQVGAQVRAQVHGNHDAGWLSFHATLLKFGIKDCAKLEPLMRLAKVCGWWAPYANAVIFQDRPSELHRDEQGRLHNQTGAAVLYRDGFGVFAVHGVRVPAWIILHPEQITPAKIDAEQNAEVRRVMVEKFGQERYLREGNTKLVHKDDWGELYWKDQPGDEPIVMVKVVNSTPEADGSFKDYFLQVHPELRPLLPNGKLGEPQELTAHNAVASTWGLRGTEYAPAVET